MRFLKKVLQPETYQGSRKPKEYFEGWYYKHLSNEKKDSFVIIPGVSYEKDDAHAFIQVIIGSPLKPYYIRYPLDAFTASKDTFDISIGNNQFSRNGIYVNIDEQGLQLKAHLQYQNLTPLNRTILNPTIMGYFAYLPFMQCNHGVVSLQHSIVGDVVYSGKPIKFNNGTGYMEKDWGTSFPKKYIWLQCNNFDKDVTLFFSVAHIPFLANAFIGHIAVFTVGKQQYRFATYTGSKQSVAQPKPGKLLITLENKHQKLLIEANYKEGMALKAPKKGIMSDTIKETLDANITISFYEDDKLLIQSTGTNAGLEVVNYV